MGTQQRAAVIVGATAPEIIKLIEAIKSAGRYPVLGTTAMLSGPYKDCWVVNIRTAG
jgi:hypothetical protein